MDFISTSINKYILSFYNKPIKREIIFYFYFTGISNLGSCKAERLNSISL